MKVLVTAVSGPTAVGVIRCLKDDDDVELYGTDIVETSIGKKWCKEVYKVVKHFEMDTYIEQLKEIILKNNIDCIIPTLQEELESVSAMAKEIGKDICVVKNYELKRLLNKQYIYVDMKEKGLEKYVPKYEVCNNFEDFMFDIDNKFKQEENFCLKPVNGHGGKGFCRVTKNKEKYLNNLLNSNNFYYIDDIKQIYRQNFNEVMICELLDGEEFSVDIMRYNNKIISTVSRIRTRVSTGIVIDGKVIYNKDVIKAAQEIVEKFKLEGFLNIQFIVLDNEIKLIDLNPRFCGSQIMSYAAGVNFPLLMLKAIKNEKVDSIEPNWNVEIKRYWEAVFYNDKGDII